ncbi:MAG: oxidoreductase, partial [Ruthenibacterium sp.]
MKQTASIISTYAADVSGVASALFELGGMTVMHDASGCNS